jgi:hypothetical protein
MGCVVCLASDDGWWFSGVSKGEALDTGRSLPHEATPRPTAGRAHSEETAMTASVPVDSTFRSRRALLAGAVGGLGAVMAAAIGRATPVLAGVDGDVALGGQNTATTETRITNSTNGMQVFTAQSTGAGTAVTAYSQSGLAIYAESQSKEGVVGYSNSGIGVRGHSYASGPATAGWSTGNSTGLLGYSSGSSGTLVAAKAKTGVYGYAAQDTTSTGVWGATLSGSGVRGDATSGLGVMGTSVGGSGVYGVNSSATIPAILGRSAANNTGVFGCSGSVPASPAKTGVFGYASQDSASVGVRGESPAGIGVYGKTTGTGFAGYFNGKTFMSQFVEIAEITAPAAPSGNRARLFVRDSGGKTQLCVRFPTGAVKVLATES